jgi:hypothetical protein
VIGESPRISKRDLAVKILGATNPEDPETPEHTARKTQLAADLHYLVRAGHVIEFADGRLDLPLATDAPGSKADAVSAEDEETHEESDALSEASAAPAEEQSLSETQHHFEESSEPIADASVPTAAAAPCTESVPPTADHEPESTHHEALKPEEPSPLSHSEQSHPTLHES